MGTIKTETIQGKEDDAMQTKILGRSGIKVPIIGLGGANLGLPSTEMAYVQHVEDTQHISYANIGVGIETVCEAIKNGSTWIDTAPKYLNNESETIIGQALHKYPKFVQKAAVTTKVGLVYAGDGFDYSYGAAMKCFQGSMERLGLNHFPVVYIHDPMGFPMDFVMGKGGAMQALRQLKEEGRIAHIGIAADEPEIAAGYIETGEFDVAAISGAYSLICLTALKRIFPAAEKYNVGIVCTTALERGFLAVEKLDLKARYIQRSFTADVIAHVEKIRTLCEECDLPLRTVALRWVTRHPLVATVIPGARTPEEATMNAGAGKTIIPDEFWKKLEPLIQHFDVRV